MRYRARSSNRGRLLVVVLLLVAIGSFGALGQRIATALGPQGALPVGSELSEETNEDAEKLIGLVERKWAEPEGLVLDPVLKRFLRRIVIRAQYEPEVEHGDTPIPAGLITWLVGDPEANALLPSTGFKIRNARISGNLDQPIPRIVLPLYIDACRFEELVHVSGHFGNLSLRGSTFCVGVKIEETVVAGGLDLRDLRCVGSLTMRSTRIATDLQLSTCDAGDWRQCRREWHVDLQGLVVGGDLNMSHLIIDGPSDLGRNEPLVALRDVTVHGSLIARSMKLANILGYAFHAKHLRVSGDVLFDAGLQAAGGITICDSTFDGSFLMDGATLTRLDRPCLRLSDTRIGQSLFMRGITANGEVTLAGTSIGGEVLLERSQMHGVPSLGRPALVLTDARIGSSIVFGRGFVATSEVNLDGVSVTGSVNLAGGWFGSDRGIAVSMNHATVCADLRLGGTSLSEDGLEVSVPTVYEGEVTLRGARIDGTLIVEGIDWDHPDAELQLSHAEAGCLFGVPTVAAPGPADEDRFETWPNPGKLDLREFTYRAIVFERSFQKEALLRWLQLQTPEGPPVTCLERSRGEGSSETEIKEPEASEDKSSAVLEGKSAEEPESESLETPKTATDGQSGNGDLAKEGEAPASEGPAPLSDDPDPKTLEAAEPGGGKDPEKAEPEGCSCFAKERVPPTDDRAQPAAGSSLGEAGSKAPESSQSIVPKPASVQTASQAVGRNVDVDWIDPRGFPAGSYHQLAAVLEDMGHPDPAQWLLEQKTRDKAEYFRCEWNPFEKAWDRLFWEISRSGYRPRRAGVAALVLAGGGAVLLWIGRAMGLIAPTTPPKPGGPRRRFHVLMYALDIAIPIVDFRQAKHWIPAPCPERRWWITHPWLGRWAVGALWGWIWIGTAFGWFCATLFATGLLGLRG